MKLDEMLAALPEAGQVRRARTGQVEEVTLTLKGGARLAGVATERHGETLTLVTADGADVHLVLVTELVAVTLPRTMRNAVRAAATPRVPVDVQAFKRWISDAPIVVKVDPQLLVGDDETRGDARAGLQALFTALETVSAAAAAANGRMLEVRRVVLEVEDERGTLVYDDGTLRYGMVMTPDRLVGLRAESLRERIVDLLAEA